MAKKEPKPITPQIFLDPQIIDDFRAAINTTAIFYTDKEHKSRWSLICAVMDRIQSCVKYLNTTNKGKFDAEEEFVNFLNYCCIIKDAISELFKQAHIDYPYNDSKDFLNGIYYEFINLYSKDRPQYIPPENTPTDDKFFAFLRSLAFAHPLETNRARFIENGETLYSPFVMVYDCKRNVVNPVGLNIYSNRVENTMHLWFSLDIIKAYINSRYELLKVAIQWVDKTKADFEMEWKKRKVNRTLSPLEILKDIRHILAVRYRETFQIDEAITLLECPVTDIENETAVKAYKDNIVANIPELCDWIDSLQDEEKEPNFFKAISGYPKDLHDGAGYQLEKIFGYLDDDAIDYDRYIENRAFYIRTSNDNKMCNYDWGLIQAEHFFREFGGLYVKFDIKKIGSATEIKLLANTALFFEREKQAQGQISECILQSQSERRERLSKLKVIDTIKIKTPSGTIKLNVVDSGSKNNKQ